MMVLNMSSVGGGLTAPSCRARRSSCRSSSSAAAASASQATPGAGAPVSLHRWKRAWKLASDGWSHELCPLLKWK